MPTTRMLRPDDDGLAAAAELLRAGELVAFPTETVYGLGGHALDEAAVRAIFTAKGRPADNPLIVHVADASWVERVAVATPLASRLAAEHWPGPLTLVLDALPVVPAVTRGGHPTVAVRVPSHPVARALLTAADVPLAAPSANRSGRPSPTSAAHVAADLDGLVAAIVDGGPCEVGVESTVVDARGERPVVLRDGTITREQLGAAGPEDVGGPTAATPGSRYRHYAPTCEVRLAEPGEGAAVAAAEAAAGRRVHLVASVAADGIPTTLVGGAAELGARLYGVLRDAEAAGIDVVVVETVEPTGVGRAVMDRLTRAAGRS